MWLSLGVSSLVILIFSIASFVLVRNKNKTNLTFAVFAYVTAVWIVANYVGANFKSHTFSLYFSYADFLFGAALIFFFWCFTAALFSQTDGAPRYKKLLEHLPLPLGMLTIISIIIILSPSAVKIQDAHNGLVSLSYENGFGFYTLISTFILSAGIINIFLTLRFAQKDYRKQVTTISRGLVVAVLIVGIANLVLPQLTNSKSINLIAGNAAYIGIVVFIASTSYAIVRHRLFDIHLFAVRGGAYLFSLVLMAVFYLTPILVVFLWLIGVHFTPLQFIGTIIGGIFVIAGYTFLHKVFNLLTQKIFFRNYYQSQEVLDRLSNLLVGSITPARIKTGCRDILQSVLNTYSLEYVLSTEVAPDIVKPLARLFANSKQSLVVLDEIDGTTKTVQQLQANNIGAVARLRTRHEDLGFMVIGYKRSGEVFNADDRHLLSIAADEIAISLQNALRFEQIQHFNETLQENVSEATRKLRQTNEKLQGLDATKDEFITMASHQLRTPLTAVKGYLSMVLEGDAGKLNAGQRKLLEQSYTSAQRMVYLIADLLNLSRLSTGKFVIESKPTNLADVVQGEVDQLVETARSREISLQYERPAVFPDLMLDETKIHQVVMNFIDNAIYYTPAGGTINVELRETPTTVEYLVKDTGMGVPKAEQHHLFTKFYRAENARKARPDGTGLGLFMAKKVVAGQGGAIIFESTEGKGSTFGFRFNKRSHGVTGNLATKPANTITHA